MTRWRQHDLTVGIPIYSTSIIHDYVVPPGAFDEGGARFCCRGRGRQVGVRVILHAQSCATAEADVRMVLP